MGELNYLSADAKSLEKLGKSVSKSAAEVVEDSKF